MADIQSAAQWIGRLLVEEARYLHKVEEKVKELRDELEWMQCFLRDADASQYDNVMARRWVAQIREFAYEAEDTIEKFLIRVVTNSRGRRDLFGLFKKYSKILLEARLLHQIGSDIDALKHKISLLSSKLHTYGIKLKMAESSASWLLKLRDETYSNPKEEKIIGRDEDVSKLVDRLLTLKAENRVLSICGTGGVGKTCMAKEIFDHPRIRRHFNAFAWASISQPMQISAVQQELLSSLTFKSSEQIAQMTDDELKNELYKIQRKCKCFIVLDGVWSVAVWDRLKEAFPSTNRDLGSKLLITTRLYEVAERVHRDMDKVAEHVHRRDVNIHKLQRLNGVQSKLLLEEKVRGAPANISEKADCDNVNILKEEMLKHCKGLPLAIVVLGGVLATKRTLKEWKDVHERINSYLIDQEEVPPWRRILELSYYELPYQLKPCFLYLGYFPTNLEIPTTKITRLWEAEGLVSAGDDEMSEETVQDIAEKCLGELVERSLVQVGSRGLTGKVKTCQLHDLMRELCMAKASTGNWLNVVQLGEETDKPSGSYSKSFKSSRSAKRKFRRLAIYCSGTLEKLPSDYRHARYIRSLLFFNTLASEDVLIPFKRMALRKAFTDYRLLRVLDIEKIEVQSLPDEVGFLIHLRYLSLRGSWVSKLPSTIRYLRCLQTLDLRVLSFVRVRIPDVLCRMERLTHLYLPSKPFVLRHKAAKLQLKGLANLETISNFSNICKAEDICRLVNLRKFSSCDFLNDPRSIYPILASPNSSLVHIEHISLRLCGQYLNANPYALAGCRRLHKLWVKEELTTSIFPGMLPQNLLHLSFSHSKFQDDPMPILENLLELKRLSLEHASYEGTGMRCSREGFPKLTYLTLDGLPKLEVWTIEQGAMPMLFRLEINRCKKLQMIPEGLRFVKSLQELTISYMPVSFYQGWTPVKSRDECTDFQKIDHVPCVRISHILDIQKC